jgi:thioredoxin reductase (NADPH)
MTFFSGPDSLEIAGEPMQCQGPRVTRVEGLKYYRAVARRHGLDIRTGVTVLRTRGQDGDFRVETDRGVYAAAKVVIASGYYSRPVMLGVPGEHLPKVRHYFCTGRPFRGKLGAVVGGRNSAGQAAIELARSGADVTLIHRRSSFGMKPWIEGELRDLIERGVVRAFFNSHVTYFAPDRIHIQTPVGRAELANQVVFAMTGYSADLAFLQRCQIRLSECGTRPRFFGTTMETNCPGIFLAGTAAAGAHTHEISIEDGRRHGQLVAAALIRAEAPDSIYGGKGSFRLAMLSGQRLR